MPRYTGYIDASLLADGGAQFVAGQRVNPGTYLELESRRVVRLARPDRLPASCDGRVATYVRHPPTWALVAADANG